MVIEVMENTNAKRAGLLQGDVLIRMDGQKLSSVEEVLEQIQNKNFTDLSIFNVLRDGRELQIKVKFRE
jgi:serine protease DegQ